MSVFKRRNKLRFRQRVFVFVCSVAFFVAAGLERSYAEGLSIFSMAMSGFLTVIPPTTSQVGWLCQTEAANWTTLRAAATRVVTCTTSAGFAAALTAAAAGDYIEIADSVGLGAAWGGFTCTKSGTSTKPIVIGPAPSNIDLNGRSDFNVSFTTTNRFIDLDGCAYVTFGGFKFLNYVGSAFQSLNAPNCRVTDCIFDGVGNAAIGDGWGYQVDYGCTDFRIDHCHFLNPTNQCRWDAYDPATRTNPTGRFDHNTYDGDPKNYSICQLGQGSAKFNDTTDPANNGGKWTLGVVFEYNDLNTSTGSSSGTYQEQPSNKSSGNTIRFNYYRANCRAAVLLRQCNSYQVYGNYVCGAGMLTVNQMEVFGGYHLIYNNILDLSSSTCDTGISENQGGFRTNTPAPPAHDNIIANNTFYDPNGNTDRTLVKFNSNPGGLTRNYTGVQNSQWKNNIIVRNTGTYTVPKTLVDTTPAMYSGMVVDTNIYYGTSADGDLLALDANAITGNPLLGADFTPGVGSSALGVGLTIASITDDFYGVSRGTSVDIGAVQTSSPVNAVNLNHITSALLRSVVRSLSIWDDPYVKFS